MRTLWPPAALARRLVAARRGRRVVFTNGCFDLVHSGHVKVLEQARRRGDLLVVGLNSDASVRRLKGPRRPILRLRERAAVLSAFRAVDYVTWFDEDTPRALIARLRPDVLVKGGDWAAGRIVGRDLVKRVARVPLVRGRSTSAIIAEIVRRHAG